MTGDIERKSGENAVIPIQCLIYCFSFDVFILFYLVSCRCGWYCWGTCSFYTTLCLQYQSSHIAMGAIFVAALHLSLQPVKHPRSSTEEPSWLTLLDESMDSDVLKSGLFSDILIWFLHVFLLPVPYIHVFLLSVVPKMSLLCVSHFVFCLESQ